MFTAIGQGMLFGIALCFSIGPAFFGLIQTSLKHGYGSGIAMALGIFASDLIYLLLAYFGLSGWLTDEKYAIPVGIVGGVLLIGYGIVQIMKKNVVQSVDGGPIEFKRPTRGASVLKGFLMNMFNPIVVLLWVAALGLASHKLNNDKTLIIIYFAATLATVLGTDILKSLAAAKIKNYLNEKIIHKVNTIAGIILIISGIVLMVRIFVEEPWLKK
jgi:threonine/homoserine/homoserine lactone efflux protein